MAQVKFYSVGTDASKTDANGIYFVTGGELYKGTSRFGANKVFTVPSTGQDAEGYNLASALSAAGVSAENSNAIGGDILVGYGAAKVFNGSTWVDLGQDQAALDTQLSGLVSGLAFNGEGSYITGITQGADGKVTASTSNFVTDVKTAVGDGAASSTANGITVSVTTTSGSVTGVQVDASQISCDSVTASSGTFTDLTVTSTATFSATTVSATSLTVNGSTVEQIADARISNATLTGNITAPGGTDLVNEGQVVTYVSAAIQSFDNAMHYVGTTSDEDIVQDATVAPDDISGYSAADMKAGDIVLKGTSEYIWNGAKWELIGDQGVYATKAELSASWSTLGTAAFQNFASTVDANATTLPTCDAVVNYVSGVVTGLSLGDAAQKSVADTLTSTGTSLPTESAVAGYVTGVIEGLDSNVSSSENNSIQVGVTQVDGKVTAVTADLVWLDANGDAIA